MSATPLQLDFVRRASAPARVAAWVLLLLLASACVPLADAYTHAIEQRDRAQEKLDRLSRASQPRAVRRAVAPDAQTLAELQRANGVIDQLTVPWEELFDTLEAADARRVAVLSVAPNARDHTLRLAGEARVMDDLLAYVSRLAERPTLAQVHLLGYSTTTRDGVPVISFTVAATWRPAP